MIIISVHILIFNYRREVLQLFWKEIVSKISIKTWGIIVITAVTKIEKMDISFEYVNFQVHIRKGFCLFSMSSKPFSFISLYHWLSYIFTLLLMYQKRLAILLLYLSSIPLVNCPSWVAQYHRCKNLILKH